MPLVHFELRYTVRDLTIPADVVHSLSYGGPHQVRVALAAPSEADSADGHRLENAFCTSSSSFEPSSECLAVFEDIESNAFATAESIRTRYRGPSVATISLPALSEFPEHFKSFIATVGRELSDFARRTVSALRWRANLPGPHNPLSTRGLHWSFGGSFWHPAPAEYHLVLQSGLDSFRISEQILDDTRSLVANGGSCPLEHDLFREAWEERFDNPRSAIVIGIAAAELGLKRLIVKLVPPAEWLAMNLPTPPLVKMLAEYLPTLPARRRIEGSVKAPPKEVLATLRKGVTIRNQLAHAGSKTPSPETVDEVLRAVQDLLWLLEFYGGCEWALGLVRLETRSALSTT